MIRLSIDTEGHLMSPARPVPPLVSVAFANDSKRRLIHASDPEIVPVLTRSIRAGSVYANAPHDMLSVWRQWPVLGPEILAAYERDGVADVITQAKMLDTAKGERWGGRLYNLAELCDRYLGHTMDKGADTWRLRYGELEHVPIHLWPEAARKYALDDPLRTWQVHKVQLSQACETGPNALVRAPDNARADLTLYAQTVRGIPTDQARVDLLDSDLSALIAGYEQELLSATVEMDVPTVHRTAAQRLALGDPPTERKLVGIARYKHKSWKKRQAEGLPTPIVRTKKAAQALALARAHEIGVAPVMTDGGKKNIPEVSLSEDALINLRPEDGSPLNAYRLLGGAMTMRTGWVLPMRAPLIRCAYECTINSDRTSSKEHWLFGGRNLQNFPAGVKGYRECLVPPTAAYNESPHDPWVFVVSDFGALELVALAQQQLALFGRSALADVLKAGQDPHSMFAANMLGIPIEDFDKERPEHAAMRKLAKVWNFGKPGGMGTRTFIAWAYKKYGVQLTPAEEKTKTAIWHATFPEMQMFFDYVGTLSGPDGTIQVTQIGGHVRGGMFFPDACNTHFQGLGAAAAKRSLWLLFVAGQSPQSPMYGARQVLFVHDEHVTIARQSKAQAVLVEQERLMVVAAHELMPDLPMKIDSKIIHRYAKI